MSALKIVLYKNKQLANGENPIRLRVYFGTERYISLDMSCSIQGGDLLADLFSMSLDYESTANGASPQYNGNIASMQWRTNINGTCSVQFQYRFAYDYANRLLSANYDTNSGASWANTGTYSESNISYTYGDPLRPDRLTQMAGNGAKGFKRSSGLTGDHYLYDLNGNMTQDKHKNFSLSYNYLNLL